MNKRLYKGVSVITLLCMVLGLFAVGPSVAAEAEAAAVAVPNGSFENGLESWTADYTSGTGGTPIATPGGWSPTGGGHNRLDYYLANETYTADVSQTLTGLANGTYTLSAWVERGADFTESYMYAKPAGGEEVKKDIPVSGEWVQLTQSVLVTGNSLRIGFYGAGSAAAGNYMGVDLVALTLEEAAPVKELVNASFEDGAGGWAFQFGPSGGFDPFAVTTGWSPADGGDKRLNVWSASPYTADANQTLTGIDNGTYKLSAWIASGGGFNENYMYAKSAGQADAIKAIPASAAWSRIELPLEVTNNSVTVGFYADAGADKWFAVDLIKLEKTIVVDEPVSGVEIVNRGFEEDELMGQSLVGWQEAGEISASFKKQGGYKSAGALSHYADTDYAVTTSQTLAGLEDGYYTLTAWAQNGGGQKAAYLFALANGKSEARAAIPVADDWKKVYLRGIQVTNGELVIGIHSDAKEGNRLNIDHVELVKDDNPYRLLKGGDVSELSYVESMGGKFFDQEGKEKDLFQILRENGHDIVRIRLYNDPGKGHGDGNYYRPAGFMDKNDVLKLARRAKAAGLQIQFSFHYSDFWTNGATHMIPNGWLQQIDKLETDAAKVAKLEELVGSYTKEVMDALVQQGTAPEYVSLGNEMQSGILFPYGRASGSSWNNLARFLKAGAAAVKAASPDSKVILHLDDAGNYNKYNGFFDKAEELGVPYDIIGPSYYPFWTDLTVEQIVEFCNYFSQKYDKDIMIMETGYNWNQTLPNGEIGQLNDNGPYSNDTSTPQGQKEFMINLFNGLKSVEGGRVIGDLYWDPIMIAVPGVGWAIKESDDLPDLNVVSNTTLFDFGGKALPSHDAYRYNAEGVSEGHISGVVRGSGGKAVAGAQVKTVVGGTTYQAATDAAGNYLLADLPVGSGYAVTATKAGYEGGTSAAANVTAGTFTAGGDITLKGGSVRGTVKDQAGQPAVNAEVAATIDGIRYKTATNAAGEYMLPDLPETAAVTLTAAKPGYEEGQLTGIGVAIGAETANADLRITLSSGSIAGTVKDEAGLALDNVELTVVAGKQTLKAVSGPDGAYEIANVPAGQGHEVRAAKQGFVAQALAGIHVQVGATTADVNFALAANIGQISGTVVDSDNRPVAGAEVKAELGGNSYTTITDSAGNYVLEQVLGGSNYTVTAVKKGFLNAKQSAVAVKAQETTRGVMLKLPLSIALTNASFEQLGASQADILGWVTGGTSGATFVQRHASATDGSHALSHWQEGAFISEAYQKVSGLKDGAYELSAYVYNGGDQNEFYMYIKDQAGKVTKLDLPKTSLMTPVSVKAEITGGELSIGFYADANAGNWAVIDGITLGFLGAKEPPAPEPTSSPAPATPAPAVQQAETPLPTSTPLTKVEADLNGAKKDAANRSLTVEAKPASGSVGVEVRIPVKQLLDASQEQYRTIRIDTGTAVISLDPALLRNAANDSEGHATLKVTRIDSAGLSAEQQKLLNGSEVYDFELSVNGQRFSRFEPGQIEIALPHELKASESARQVVVYYLNDDGRPEVVKNGRYDKGNGTVTFSPVHFSKYAAVYKAVGFKDLDSAGWAKESIGFMAARELVRGYSEDRFAPNEAITRAQFVKLLMNVLPQPLDIAEQAASFTDVEQGAWYADSIEAAWQLGLVKGKTDGSFGVHDSITREEMAVMVQRAMKVMDVKLEAGLLKESFADSGSISLFAQQAVTELTEAGLLKGVGGGRFAPQGSATRAQAAAVLERVYNLLV